MTAMPPPPAGYAPHAPAPQPTNVPALISLICGIVGCLLITPIIGIITGIIGLGKARPPVGGKGMAITGIILSLLWIVGFIGFGAAGFWGYGKMQEAMQTPTTDFLQGLAEGDLAKVQANSNFNAEEARGLSEQVQVFGKCTGVTYDPGFQAESVNGRNLAKTSGVATFEKAGQKRFTVTLDNSGGNTLKVQKFEIQ